MQTRAGTVTRGSGEERQDLPWLLGLLAAVGRRARRGLSRVTAPQSGDGDRDLELGHI